MSDITVTVTDDTDISLTVSPTADLSGTDTDSLSEGSTNLYHTSERVDDRVNALLQAGSNITLTYDDTANTLTVAAATTDDLSDNDTDDLAEGSTNLYYTDARVDTALTTVGGHILPAADDAQDLGSPTKQWRELYLGPQSLYIDGVQLISRTADVYDFTTDSGQQIRIQPNNHLTLESISGDVKVRSSGKTDFETGNVEVSSGNVSVTGNISATGFIQTGGTGLKTDLITDAADIRIETGDSSYLHLDTGNVYVGSFSQAVHITGTEVKGLGTHPNITANNLTVGGTLSGIDTDDVSEGSSNLYYTDARADARIANNIIDEDSFATDSATRAPSQQSTKAYIAAQIQTKDQLSELSGDTDDVAEGSTNLYYTDTRARAVSIENVVEDTTPQLGGNLDLNSNNIDGTGNIDITGALTLSGDITGDSGDLNIVNSVDGSAVAIKIDDTGGTTHTGLSIKEDDFTTGGSTAYKSYILQDEHGIKIGDSGEFSANGQAPSNAAGNYTVNGAIINPTGNTWPSINIVSTGRGTSANPLIERFGLGFAGGQFDDYPNGVQLFSAANGTTASPVALGDNKRVGQIAYLVYDGNGYGGSGAVASASITVTSQEAASTSNARGVNMIFDFLPIGGAATDGDNSSDRVTALTLDHNTFDVGTSSNDVTQTYYGNATFKDDVTIEGNIDGNTTFSDNLTVNGNTVLGNSSSDNITVNGRFDDHLISDSITNLGSSSQRWGFLYAEDFDISIDGNVGRDLDVGRDATVTGNLQVDGSQVDFTNLPTSDPAVSGRLWNDSGTVKISAG